MRPVSSAIRKFVFPAMIATAGIAAAQPVTQPCGRCGTAILPGATVPHPKTRWGIISDLPESFSGYGVLYATTQVLPESPTVPASMATRTQVAAPGFTGIDDSFDVFFFHLLAETTGTARLVVYGENRSTAPVTISPHQAIQTEGIIGAVHEMESQLAEKVLSERWDASPAMPSRMTLMPGAGQVIAVSKKFGDVTTGPDASRNRNCFGYARALVESSVKPALDVYVIAIPAVNLDGINDEAAKWKSVAAISHDKVSMTTAPQGCAVGRAVGVYPNFIWQSVAKEIDLATIPENGLTTFPIALPEVQSRTCTDARQTTDLALRPLYTRPDTIGNYMIEYRVAIPVTNSSDTTKSAALVFGKQEADVGLTYFATTYSGALAADKFRLSNFPLLSQWAGPKQSSPQKAMIPSTPVCPGETKTLAARFLINGNSSLPFYLGISRDVAYGVNP